MSWNLRQGQTSYLWYFYFQKRGLVLRCDKIRAKRDIVQLWSMQYMHSNKKLLPRGVILLLIFTYFVHSKRVEVNESLHIIKCNSTFDIMIPLAYQKILTFAHLASASGFLSQGICTHIGFPSMWSNLGLLVAAV